MKEHLIMDNSWSAEVELNNGSTMVIWYTAFPMMLKQIKCFNWIASDYPRNRLSLVNHNLLILNYKA